MLDESRQLRELYCVTEPAEWTSQEHSSRVVWRGEIRMIMQLKITYFCKCKCDWMMTFILKQMLWEIRKIHMIFSCDHEYKLILIFLPKDNLLVDRFVSYNFFAVLRCNISLRSVISHIEISKEWLLDKGGKKSTSTRVALHHPPPSHSLKDPSLGLCEPSRGLQGWKQCRCFCVNFTHCRKIHCHKSPLGIH